MIKFNLSFDLFNSYYYIYERLIVLLFSLVPSILLVIFVLYTDRKSKEPKKNIILCLLSGILTVSVAAYFEELVMPYFANNYILTYVFAFIEEFAKMAIFFLFIFDNKHYDDIYDGIVYMALIALSFAGLENIMYAFSESTVSQSISLALMRDFTTIPLHVICGVVIGHYLAISTFCKDKTKKVLNIVYAFLISTLIHGTFNNLMSLLSEVNNKSTLSIFLFQTMPLVLIMISLFLVAFIYSRKTIILNDMYYDNNYNYKYDYLMTHEEYLNSYVRKKRLKLSEKIKFYKFKNKKGEK